MILIVRVCIFNFVILHCLERKISTLFHAQLMVKCHCGGVNATSLVTSHDKIFLSVLMRYSAPNLTSPFFKEKNWEIYILASHNRSIWRFDEILTSKLSNFCKYHDGDDVNRSRPHFLDFSSGHSTFVG